MAHMNVGGKERSVCAECWQGLYPARLVPPVINEAEATCEMCGAVALPNQSTWVKDEAWNFPHAEDHDPDELNRVLAETAAAERLAALPRGEAGTFLSEANQTLAAETAERAAALEASAALAVEEEPPADDA